MIDRPDAKRQPRMRKARRVEVPSSLSAATLCAGDQRCLDRRHERLHEIESPESPPSFRAVCICARPCPRARARRVLDAALRSERVGAALRSERVGAGAAIAPASHLASLAASAPTPRRGASSACAPRARGRRCAPQPRAPVAPGLPRGRAAAGLRNVTAGASIHPHAQGNGVAQRRPGAPMLACAGGGACTGSK
jgi:hypothetical protein